jgi:hypothetical protein
MCTAQASPKKNNRVGMMGFFGHPYSPQQHFSFSKFSFCTQPQQ